MSLTPLNFNSNGAPEPAEDNTITLREYTGGPIAQFDAEQNFVNLKGRINDLLNSVSVIGTDSTNTGQTIWQNLESIDAKASLIDTTLTDQINQINTQLSGSGNIDATTLDVSGAVTTGELTVDKTLKIKSGNSEATFIANDAYESLTIKPRSGSDQGSVFFETSDLEVGGDAQIEGDLNIQGKLVGNGAIIGSGGLTSPLNNALVQNDNTTRRIEVAMGLRGAPAVAKWGIFTINMIGNSYPTHEVWVFSGANYTYPNMVAKNSSDKSQDMTVQFMAPIIDGKCWIENKELSSDNWSMYCMGWL